MATEARDKTKLSHALLEELHDDTLEAFLAWCDQSPGVQPTDFEFQVFAGLCRRMAKAFAHSGAVVTDVFAVCNEAQRAGVLK